MKVETAREELGVSSKFLRESPMMDRMTLVGPYTSLGFGATLNPM